MIDSCQEYLADYSTGGTFSEELRCDKQSYSIVFNTHIHNTWSGATEHCWAAM